MHLYHESDDWEILFHATVKFIFGAAIRLGFYMNYLKTSPNSNDAQYNPSRHNEYNERKIKKVRGKGAHTNFHGKSSKMRGKNHWANNWKGTSRRFKYNIFNSYNLFIGSNINWFLIHFSNNLYRNSHPTVRGQKNGKLTNWFDKVLMFSHNNNFARMILEMVWSPKAWP